MKKFIYFMIFILCFLAVFPALAVKVSEDGTNVIVETAGYKVYWKKAAQMGYIQAFVGGSADTIIGTAGRAFYHSSDYGGWKDWGAMIKWKIVEEKPGMAKVQYESKDGGQKLYTCVAYYYDSVPYIKHEVTVTADGTVTSFQSGHEPMFEINTDIEGMEAFTQPFPHVVYWTKEGFFSGLYGPDSQQARKLEWAPRNPGRMDLLHDNLGEALKKGDSHTITYFVSFGKGKQKEAAALANDVQKDPGFGKAVSPVGTLTTTWGWTKGQR